MNARSPSQLPLPVSLHDDARLENYIAADNASALAAVTSLTTSLPMDNYLYLWGPVGAGCSHLLQACCHAYAEQGRQAFYLPLSEVRDYGPEVLDSMETMDLLCLDDLQSVLGDAAWEQALFHLYNRLRDSGQRLLIAADASPRQLPIQLADLQSRLCSGLIFQLQPLDDEHKLIALQRRAKNRGLELQDEAAQYILSRHSRDMSALFAALETLDQASLTAQRKLTIPFIKSVFGW